ncbi:MAG: homoserine dehydrogenase [Acidobacteriia bacterium]|nr:homoserine dehydrogenase [Terriglobia bacterium]
MKEVRVGIVGFGTVGQATAQLLAANADLIEERSGVRLAVTVVCRRTPIPAELIPAGARACASWTDVVSAPDVDVVVETIGGNGIPREVVNRALISGKPVVTANKALIAKYGDEILAHACERRLPVGIEATTAGGIPIVRALRRSATSDQVIKIYGVLNGTVNYILSRMETEGLEFQAALTAAQQAGYAEADPSLDIDGIDARDKLCILARMAFNLRLHPEDIPVTGVRQVSQVDLQYARRLGGRIRLVGAAEHQDDGIAVTVRPWLVPQNSMLGKVEGVFNAIFVEGERSGTQMFYGRGAGGPATSTAVVADLIGIAQGMASKTPGRNPMPGFGPISALPLTTSGTSCEWYLRLSVRDHPGILARVASVLAELEINIDSVLQEPHLPKERLSFVITVETVSERTIRMAIERINQFEFLTEPALLVRMFAG